MSLKLLRLLAVVVLTGVGLLASQVFELRIAHAGDVAPPATEPMPSVAGSACTCPESNGKPVKPKFAGFNDDLDESDEIATLASIQHALLFAADGTSYVWRRSNGHLSGVVHAKNSFRNADGLVCRHILVLLTTGYVTRKTEGTACRSADGRWELEG